MALELIGPNVSVEAVAQQADTIPYEILAALGPRLSRRYVEAAALQEVQA